MLPFLNMDKILDKYCTKKTLILFLVFFGLVLYLNSFFNEFVWDDESIIKNTYVKDWRHIPKYFTQNFISGAGETSNYWRPLLLVSFSLDWKIAKWHVFFYHLHNLILHIISAILLFLILEHLFKRKYFSFLISLFFLVHPLQTEAVTYISGRGDSLSAVFIFFSLFLFAKSFDNSERSVIKKRYFLSLFCFILALLSKETAMVTPFLMALLMLGFQEKFFKKAITRSLKKERIKEILFLTIKILIPFFIILAIFVSLRLTILNFQNILNFWQFQNDYSQHVYVRIFTFFRAILTYLELIFLPLNLHMERYIPIETSFFTFSVFPGLFMFFGMIVLAIRDFLISFFSLGRAPHQSIDDALKLKQAEPVGGFALGEFENAIPPAGIGGRRTPFYFFGIGWFLIALAPYSNILIPINGIIYEHWMYLPLIGIFICAINFFENIFKEKKDFLKNLAILFLVFFLTFFSVVTILRNRDWKDSIALYNQILKYNKTYRVYNNLGNAYSDIGEYEKAKENYLKAINFDPGFPQPEAYNNLGLVFFRQNKYDEAIFYYQEALKVRKNYPTALINLGDIYLRKKDWAESKKYYLLYNQLFPYDFYPYFKLGEISFHERNCSESMSYLGKAKEVAPPDKEVQENLFLLIEEAKKCQKSQ